MTCSVPSGSGGANGANGAKFPPLLRTADAMRARFETIVTLADGSVVGSWSQEWKAECFDRHAEAVRVLRFSERDARRAHLDRHELEHGAESRKRLEAEIMRVWTARRVAAGIA